MVFETVSLQWVHNMHVNRPWAWGFALILGSLLPDVVDREKAKINNLFSQFLDVAFPYRDIIMRV